MSRPPPSCSPPSCSPPSCPRPSRPRARPGRRPGWLALVLATAAIGVPGIRSAAADYRLARGDLIEIAVADIPEWRQRLMIQLDGTLSIPVIGTVMAEGATPAELQGRIEAILATKVLRQKAPDGRERLVVVQPGELSVTVAEYRPIFVGGDVQTPGQYAYRPSMSVRHALAVAGGASVLKGRAMTADLEVVELEREYRATLTEFARETVRTWRLAAELQGSDKLEERGFGKIVVPAPLVADLLRFERRSLQVAIADFAKERTYLDFMIRQGDDQIQVLTAQEKGEQRGVEADTEELERTMKLFGNGNLTSQRVTENRRAVLLSSTRRLQTSASLSEMQRRREEFAWRRGKLDTQRELDLIKDAREAQSKAADFAARLDSVRQKLMLMGRQRVLDGTGSSALLDLLIVRRTASGWDRVPASEETELQPGDGVEVTLRRDASAGVATR